MNRPDDSPKNSILIYTTEDGLTKIDTTFDGDTVWLSIDQMAELFALTAYCVVLPVVTAIPRLPLRFPSSSRRWYAVVFRRWWITC